MISFIARVKPLTAATEYMLKSEALRVPFCGAFQCTFHTKTQSLSNSAYEPKKNSVIKKSYHTTRSISKKFGRIIELEGDFSALEVEHNERSKKFERRNRNDIHRPPEVRQINAEKADEIEVQDEGDRFDEKLDGRSYRAMDRNSRLLSSIMLQLKSKKLKERNQNIVIEGKRLIYEAIKAGLVPLKIFFSRATDLEEIGLPEGIETFRIPYKSCQLWADVTTPQGIIGIFEMPKENTVKAPSNCLPLTIICDNIRDPGNLGSIVRTAAGVGCERLILTLGCTGVWEPKVLRAGAGAHFYFPIIKNSVWSDIEDLISVDSQVFIADSTSGSQVEEDSCGVFTKISEISKNLPLTPYYSVEFEKKSTVLIIGGETEGVSDDAYIFAEKRSGTRIYIPTNVDIESLNNSVALGVLAFEYKRQFCINEKEQKKETSREDDSPEFGSV